MFGEHGSHMFFATHAYILTSGFSNTPLRMPSPTPERSPTLSQALISVECFSPDTFSAQSRSTSELLRTLSRVAASKPTSWLSLHDHLVLHLALTLGP